MLQRSRAIIIRFVDSIIQPRFLEYISTKYEVSKTLCSELKPTDPNGTDYISDTQYIYSVPGLYLVVYKYGIYLLNAN